MINHNIQRQIANLVQRAPWLVYAARRVWRFRQTKFTAGAVGVVFNPAGEILLVEHVFHPNYPWGLPGGWVDYNENPAQTVQRELREELELTVQVGPLLLFEVAFGSHFDLAYLCETTDQVGQLSRELLNYRWTAPGDLPQLHGFHYHAVQAGLARRVHA